MEENQNHRPVEQPWLDWISYELASDTCADRRCWPDSFVLPVAPIRGRLQSTWPTNALEKRKTKMEKGRGLCHSRAYYYQCRIFTCPCPHRGRTDIKSQDLPVRRVAVMPRPASRAKNRSYMQRGLYTSGLPINQWMRGRLSVSHSWTFKCFHCIFRTCQCPSELGLNFVEEKLLYADCVIGLVIVATWADIDRQLLLSIN